MQNKNFLIGALAVLLLLASIWGQLENGKRKHLEQENQKLQAQTETLTTQQDELALKGKKMTNVQQELESLRQEKEALQAHVAKQTEELTALKEQKKGKLADCQAEKEEVAAQAAELATAQDKVKELEAMLLQRQEQFVQELKKLEEQLTQEDQGKVQELEALLSQRQEQYVQELKKLEAQVAELKALLLQRQEQYVQELNNVEAQMAEQEKKLVSAAKVIERDHKRIQLCEENEAEFKACKEALKHTSEELAQAQKLAAAAAQEIEALRAQIIGLERIVEQRSEALNTCNRELNNCKINTNVLINRISELEQGQPKSKGGKL